MEWMQIISVRRDKEKTVGLYSISDLLAGLLKPRPEDSRLVKELLR
jgi:hypothetical protein